jgi:hypothetical protein
MPDSTSASSKDVMCAAPPRNRERQTSNPERSIDLTAFRSCAGPKRVRDGRRRRPVGSAELENEFWNLHEIRHPQWSPPTHAMQILHYAEKDSISATSMGRLVISAARDASRFVGSMQGDTW